MFLRYDLPWESPWAHDSDVFDDAGQWMGPPEPDLQELRFNWGTNMRNLHKAKTDILPSDTMLIHLTPDEETILEQMKPKTRYNIRLAQTPWRHRQDRIVQRHGYLLRPVCPNLSPQWHHTASADLFRCHVRLARPTEALDLSTDFDLLVAEDDSFPLAALFVVYSSTQATYLFGASSSQRRNLMGTYALQWEAIRRAKTRGCTLYDLFGTAPNGDPSHPMHGL